MISAEELPEALKKAGEATGATAFVSSLKNPFRILISTILSARTKDEVTSEVTSRLFSRVQGFRELDRIDRDELEKILIPINFYRNKAKYLKATARKILQEHGGRVPRTIDELVELPGVGRKTANLVVSVAFGKPGICVDTHVHRITNRWGLVETESPGETEMVLRELAPQKLWQVINDILVPFGKEVCTPTSPWCSRCPLAERCARRGVTRSR